MYGCWFTYISLVSKSKHTNNTFGHDELCTNVKDFRLDAIIKNIQLLNQPILVGEVTVVKRWAANLEDWGSNSGRTLENFLDVFQGLVSNPNRSPALVHPGFACNGAIHRTRERTDWSIRKELGYGSCIPCILSLSHQVARGACL